MNNLTCSKCGGTNIVVQTIEETRKAKKPAWQVALYWIFIGIWWEPIKWIFLTLPAILFAVFKKRDTVKTISTQAKCGDCGNKWAV